MTALTAQLIVDAGTKPTFGAATVSDTAPIGSGHDSFLVYKNAAGSPTNLTIVVPGNTEYGAAYPDPVIAIPATTGEVWVPIRKIYDDGTGSVTLTLSSATSVTVALIKVSW